MAEEKKTKNVETTKKQNNNTKPQITNTPKQDKVNLDPEYKVVSKMIKNMPKQAELRPYPVINNIEDLKEEVAELTEELKSLKSRHKAAVVMFTCVSVIEAVAVLALLFAQIFG